MSPSLSPSSTHPPRRRVDVHCHCLAGVDDGPRTMDESIALCRLLVEDGFTDAVATPHQLGRYDGVLDASDIRARVAQLQQALDAERIPLTVHAGAEVRVDERIPMLLRDDRILTLADRRTHLLLELSTSAYIEPQGLLKYLASHVPAVRVILAHAERYGALQRDPSSAQRWLEGGAVLQVNADAIAGAAGADAQRVTMNWIERGWVALVATDAHGTGTRRPRMSDAMHRIRARFGDDVADAICVEGPLGVIDSRGGDSR